METGFSLPRKKLLLECWVTSWKAKGQCAQFIKVQPYGGRGTEALETSQQGTGMGGTIRS